MQEALDVCLGVLVALAASTATWAVLYGAYWFGQTYLLSPR